MNHIKLGLFIIKEKISNLIYKLDLPARIKIYPVQYIAMLKPAHGDIEPPVYKIEMYKRQEENEWDI